jgi:hypothetical protein
VVLQESHFALFVQNVHGTNALSLTKLCNHPFIDLDVVIVAASFCYGRYLSNALKIDELSAYLDLLTVEGRKPFVVATVPEVPHEDLVSGGSRLDHIGASRRERWRAKGNRTGSRVVDVQYKREVLLHVQPGNTT